ncbi:hypothetical protein GBAR_LOCUS12625, partial [Geodia barretti]
VCELHPPLLLVPSTRVQAHPRTRSDLRRTEPGRVDSSNDLLKDWWYNWTHRDTYRPLDHGIIDEPQGLVQLDSQAPGPLQEELRRHPSLEQFS